MNRKDKNEMANKNVKDFHVPKAENMLKETEPNTLIKWVDLITKATDKEKSVIKMRFGFNGEEPMTLEAVGNQLGVTRERIRQIEAKSIRKLRNYKTRLLLEDYIPKK